MEPEHATVAADYLKYQVVIYILDPVNPLNNNIFLESEEYKTLARENSAWATQTVFNACNGQLNVYEESAPGLVNNYQDKTINLVLNNIHFQFVMPK